MALYLYNPDDVLDESKVVRDVEEASYFVRLQNDVVTANLLKEIDKAEYYNDIMFRDRFGANLYLSCLSTGCKAALCVHYLQDKIIDLKECGMNARDAILWHCKDGNAIFYGIDCDVNTYKREKKEFDIHFDGRTFNDMEVFNDYIRNVK